MSDDDVSKNLGKFEGIIVPQGWGQRGVEGKIKAVEYARENNVPYLGLCFGMQMATVEFARNVLGLGKANTTEADPKTNCPVIHVMDNQKKFLLKKQYGGTIRLGAWPCKVKTGTKLEAAYKKFGMVKEAAWFLNPDKDKKYDKRSLILFERHRHSMNLTTPIKAGLKRMVL